MDMNSDDIRELADKLIKYGGSFEKGLGYALFYADCGNAIKIINTWPNLVEKYKKAPVV
jgi:hypothetical protein